MSEWFILGCFCYTFTYKVHQKIPRNAPKAENCICYAPFTRKWPRVYIHTRNVLDECCCTSSTCSQLHGVHDMAIFCLLHSVLSNEIGDIQSKSNCGMPFFFSGDDRSSSWKSHPSPVWKMFFFFFFFFFFLTYLLHGKQPDRPNKKSYSAYLNRDKYYAYQ